MYSVSSETSKTELFANIIIGFQPWCHEIIRTYLFFPEVCLAVSIAGVYSVPSQTSKIELFAKIVNSFQPLTIFVKSSTLDVSLGSECASIMKKEEQMRNKYVSLIWMVKLNLVLDRELSYWEYVFSNEGPQPYLQKSCTHITCLATSCRFSSNHWIHSRII